MEVDMAANAVIVEMWAINDFFRSLDFTYDAGYGSQELDGTVWLLDGTWFTRGEYDGSEWWEYHVLPEIPSELA